jgi:hypothetical protein
VNFIFWTAYFKYYPVVGKTNAPQRPKGKPGRMPKRDLDPVIDVLIDYWERKCGPGSFSADWAKRNPSEQIRKPLTPAAAFICDVIELIDPARLREVPKTIERVRAQRKRRATSPIPCNRGSDSA